MKKIALNTERHAGHTIMIFTEGTILKPKSWLTLYNHHSYVPIGNAVSIIQSWEQQGANIIYCTSRKKQTSRCHRHLVKAIWISRYVLGFTRIKRAVSKSC